MATTPRCPYCNAQGLKHLSVQTLGAFSLVFCGQCGAIYGVVPSPQPAAQPAKPPPAPADKKIFETIPGFFDFVGNADLSKKIPYDPKRIMAAMRASGQLQATNRRRIPAPADGPPVCPDHQFEMVQATIPPGYKNAGVRVWVCPHGNCRHYHLVA